MTIPAFSAHPAIATAQEATIAAIMQARARKEGHAGGIPKTKQEIVVRRGTRPKTANAVAAVLAYIKAHPRCTKADMSRHFGIADGTVSDYIQTLRGAGERIVTNYSTGTSRTAVYSVEEA